MERVMGITGTGLCENRSRGQVFTDHGDRSLIFLGETQKCHTSRSPPNLISRHPVLSDAGGGFAVK